MPDLRIQLAVEADGPAIAAVLHDAFIDYKPLYTPGGFDATALNSEQVKERISEGPVWIVLRDNQTVATGAAVQKEAGLYIRGMAVAPEARGQKIGELLLGEAEKFASANGIKRLFLSTTPFLARAIRLYEKGGFRRIDEGASDLFGTPLFTMEKILNDAD